MPLLSKILLLLCQAVCWLATIVVAVSHARADNTLDLGLFPAEELSPPAESAPLDPQAVDLPLDATVPSEFIDRPVEGRPVLDLSRLNEVVVDEEQESLDQTFMAYNTTRSATTWLPGHDDQFGWVSLESFGMLEMGTPGGIVSGMGFHFLDGPVQTEMPPRLFDFSIGYQRREWIRPNFGWDFVFRVGVFSDFEGSAKDGVRFPSHAVTFWKLSETTTWLLGVDYLDWDDLNLLPVFGFVWTPSEDFRIDAVFPRPRVSVRVMDSSTWLYVAGEIWGGTWAIERNDAWDDNATYHDLRLVFGIETGVDYNISSALEIGYVFDRELNYRSRIGDYSPEACLMVRFVGRY
jgi:hypothetical protein